MVRLEKIIYEQLVNTKTFKRERILGKPTKWYTEYHYTTNAVQSHMLFNEGITSKIYQKLEWFLGKFVYQWAREVCTRRGLALEDVFLFECRELRRDPYFEHIARQSFHPYQWILFNKRRARYYKTELGVKGTISPDYLQKQAEQRIGLETAYNMKEWSDFKYIHFTSDQTPTGRSSILTKFFPLEFISTYGLFRIDAWDRYFLNEIYYDSYSQTRIEDARKKIFGYDLSSAEQRKDFQARTEQFIKNHPGLLTRPGESFNFKEFFANWDAKNSAGQLKYDQEFLDSIKLRISERKEEHDHEHHHSHSLPYYLKGDKKTTFI